MFGINEQSQCDFQEDYHDLEDYQSNMPRWCSGCGDNAILAAVQRFCRDKQFSPEKTVFVSGIGCAARFPHYMNTYGFHGLHGRALPVAQGVKIRRPDLNVFVNMGDGDCCSIGTAHWIHAVRTNMNMVAMLHDNNIYGLTKMQISPTSPAGTKSKTTPYGSLLEPLNPLSTTLGVTNVSFVAQVVEWIPEFLYEVIKMAYAHKGFSFIRILQRCPHFMPEAFSSALQDPNNLMVLKHKNGMQVSDAMAKFYKNHEEHDPSDLNRAREIAEISDKTPVGILYRNDKVVTYDEVMKPDRVYTPDLIQKALEKEFAKFAVVPGKKR